MTYALIVPSKEGEKWNHICLILCDVQVLNNLAGVKYGGPPYKMERVTLKNGIDRQPSR